METRLFKTKKLAQEYISENYPDATLRKSSISEDSDINERDMPNLQWQGETPAYLVEDAEGNNLALIGWWDEGEDEYKLYVGKELAGTFDNNYDAREAFNNAVEAEEYKDEDEEEVFDVRLFCNGEDISD